MRDMFRVLIIDDHAVVRDVLRAQLRQAGIDVVGEAADFDDGLCQARRLRPEIIILDAVIPLTNGHVALAALANALPDTRIIYLGSDADARYADAALRAGADAYVFKDDADTRTVPTVKLLAAPRRAQGRRASGTARRPDRTRGQARAVEQ